MFLDNDQIMGNIVRQIHLDNVASFEIFFDIFSDLHCEAKTCNQAGTYENILANYCQADFGKYT